MKYKSNLLRHEVVMCVNFILIVTCLVSCKHRTNVAQPSVDSLSESDKLMVFRFDDVPSFDTLSEENIIESIKYILLSSEREAMMPKSLIIRKFSKEFLAIEFSGSPKQPKIFDLNGNYIKDAFHIGRGPNELSNLMTFAANEKSNKAYFLSFDKILSLNMNDYSMFTRTIPNSLENHVSFDWCALNNGDLVTKTSFPVEDFETNKYPFLFVYDSCFNKVKEHYYSHSRDLYQNLISGVTPPPCEAWSISSSPNGGTFIDMYSDTIYSILDGGELKPAYIISRGDKYMPTIEEVNYPADKKFKKIYYRYIVENDQYVILHYAYDNKYFVNIWNKQNGKLLCHQEVSSMLFYPIDFSIGGFHGELYVDYITSDNCIYVAIPARDLMEEIPGLKPDDNPVIVEIKLKDNYNPIKQ